MSKTNQGGTKAAETTKAGKAASPQDTAGKTRAAKGHVVAEGHAFHGRNGRIEAGTAVTAADLKSAKDPTGEREFKRQLEKGAIVPGKGRTADDVDGERAGGGVIDQGGATGAAPSGAQVTAANTGDDPDAAKVVDAALSGSAEELAEANGAPAADAGKGE